MRRLLGMVTVLVVVAWFAGSSDLAAQALAAADRAPRFYLASADGGARRDASGVPVLRRRVSIVLRNAPLSDALQMISDAAKLRLFYSSDLMPTAKRVSLEAVSITVTAALTEVLLDTGLDVVVSAAGKMTLVRRSEAKQVGAIVGSVTHATTKVPLATVEVFLEKTEWRTSTDTNGRYRLADVEAGDYVLTVRRLGYAKQSRRITVRDGQTDTVDIALAPQATRLDELVTTATGEQRRRQVPNDITMINADSLMQTQPIRSVTDLLEGRVPGLLLQRTSGAPGDPARLRLRGASSPNLNNDPIVVVDGVRVYAEQSARRSGNLADISLGATNALPYATPSPLDYIDPNSIETIEVVKGPSASTLYGQDAANGVIVITTKKGRAGPTRWDVGFEQGISEMVKEYPERIVRWGRALYSNALVMCPIGDFYSPPTDACVADSIVRFQLLNEPDLTPFGQGHRTLATLGVSGGVRALTYNVTGSYSHELGLLRLPDLEADRYEARLGQVAPDWMRRPQSLTQWGVTSRLAAQLGAKADLAFHVSLSQTDQHRSALENQLGSLDATYFDRAGGRYYVTDGLGLNTDPAIIDYAFSDYYTKVTAAATTLTTGGQVSWRPWPWLNTQADAGLNVVQRVDGMLLPRNASPAHDSLGALSDGQGRSLVQTLNLRANITRLLGRGFMLRLATGANYTGQSIRDVATRTTDIPAGQETPGSVLDRPTRYVDDRATFGWFVEPAVDHGNFTLVSGLRLDGGSSYGSGLSLPTFPKLGGTWTISEESFFPFKNLFSSFRLRFAYGRAGRQPGPADRLRLYATKPLMVDGQVINGNALTTLGNTQLRPERTSELEGGFDADLFDTRLSLTMTAYRKTTDDALLSTPIPPSIGFGSVIRNIGVTRNAGLDLGVTAQLVRSAPVSWTTTLLMSHRRDEVVRLGPGVEPFSIDNHDQRVEPGYPLFGFWAKPVKGYADLNGDGLIGMGEIVLGDSAVYRGAALPDYTATLQSSIGLWNGAVRLTADLLYENGMTQHPSLPLILRQVGLSPGRNDPAASLAEQARAMSALLTNYFWYQPVSTTRLNAVSVSYNMPLSLARRVGAERLTLSLQARNLGVWSNYRGVDPNVNGAANGNMLFDDGALPQPRTWQVRVNATY